MIEWNEAEDMKQFIIMEDALFPEKQELKIVKKFIKSLT
jgi:hypothetical protein